LEAIIIQDYRVELLEVVESEVFPAHMGALLQAGGLPVLARPLGGVVKRLDPLAIYGAGGEGEDGRTRSSKGGASEYRG